jgi:hypothetical protein
VRTELNFGCAVWRAPLRSRDSKIAGMIPMQDVLTKGIAACLAFSFICLHAVLTSAQPTDVAVGAIRWDAWYGQRSEPTPGYYACRTLGPRAFHFRAPWFAEKEESDRLLCDGGSQKIMDAEIAYAKNARIKYWAFVWYKPDSPMLNGWSLYQASGHKGDVDWSIVVGYGQFHLDMSRLTGYSSPEKYASFFTQAGFEKVLGGRPLVYLFRDQGATIDQLHNDVATLRQAASKAGAANPYVVIMFGDAPQAALDAKKIGADAISAYEATSGHREDRAFHALSNYVSATFWNNMAATGEPTIPLVMTGWDSRPQYDNPLPWDKDPRRAFYETASAGEIAAEVSNLLSWMKSHPQATPANAAIIYAWNEFTEGGWICPTWTDHGPDTSRIDAIAKVLH